MADALLHFHFIRPWLLLALVPLLLIVWLIRRQLTQSTGWRDLIAPELLGHLLDGNSQKAAKPLLLWLALGWLIATLALAGPAWEERPSPVHRQGDALVMVLDLSPSMVAEDVTPTRMVRARLKVADILNRRQEGETALIVYADDAYVVSPLTSDSNTIATMLPILSPSIMPLPGSQTEAAINQAVAMLTQAGLRQGQLLLITDGVDERALSEIHRTLRGTDYTLSILGVGTDEGAPIPSGRGGFVRDSNNAVIVSRLNSERLAALAREHGGRYRTSHFDSSDLDALLGSPSRLDSTYRSSDQTVDQWYDRGPWLVLLLLPLLLYCFRRGVLLALLLLPASLLYSPGSLAQGIDSLWLNRDQQGARALAEGDAATAQQRFKDPAWKGTAAYRAGDYDSAIGYFAEDDTAGGHYNRGNALAQAGKLDEAIEAYQHALNLDPDLQQAADNKALLEQLKQQQEQQQQSEQDSDTGDSGDNGDSQPQADDNSADNGQPPEERDPSASESDADQSNSTDNTNSDNPEAASGDYTPEPSDIGDEEGDPQQQPAADKGQAEATEQPAMDEGITDSNTEQGTDEQAAAFDAAAAEKDQEADQALEQWLRQIPDDPAGLLRNRLRHEHQQRRQERLQQRFDAQDSDHQRW